MPLPSEYKIGDALRSIDDMIVYRAEHPIHGTVNVYLVDNNLPWELSGQAKKRLYQNGRHMRNMSLLNIPYIIKALEVSQNPKEPYIVTKHQEHDLEEFISNGVVIPTKRLFSILLQVFDVIISLKSNGWDVGKLHPRQIKLSNANTGDIGFNMIEGTQQLIETSDNADDKHLQKDDNKIQENRVETSAQTQDINNPPSVDQDTATQGITQKTFITTENKQSTLIQNNIHLLGNVSHQLLFGRKYEASDKAAAVNIRKLPARWRAILEKALNQEADNHYEQYETIKRDVYRALTRNKRIAVYSIPVWLILILITGHFSYEKYHEHKIMTSEAGQAIKSFLDIVEKTDSEIPELEKPETSAAKPADSNILRPFEEIETVSDAD